MKNYLIELLEAITSEEEEQDRLQEAFLEERISLEELEVMAGKLVIEEVGTTLEIKKSFSHTTRFEQIPSFHIGSTLYVPFTGNLITPELAERRKELNRTEKKPLWAEEMCSPAYHITFRPAKHCSWMLR